MQFENHMMTLCKELRLRNIHKRVSAIYGFPRGGLPIAVHLSHHLNVPLLLNFFELDSYDSILAVDDIVDSGKTFTEFIERVGLMDLNVYSASLYYKKQSIFLPDIYLHETTDWIVFPWETKYSKTAPDRYDIFSNIGLNNQNIEEELEH